MADNADNKSNKDKDNSDEDIKLDFSFVKKIFSNKKLNMFLLTFLLVIIPVILTIYIRVQPQYLPMTDSWAQNSVNNYYRNMISQQVNVQYPNLPQQNKDALINQQFSEFQKANADQLKQQIDQTSQYFKSGFQYQENDITYTLLGDLDSYSFLRIARNIERNGHTCDELRDEKCLDNHMLAPIGLFISPIGSMHENAIYYSYKIFHFFNPKINMMQAQFYLPTLIAVIAAIAAFFIGRRLMNEVAGFFAAMLLALSPLFITRTLGADTDIWNVMFPLLIMWVFLEAIESKELWKKIAFTSLAGLLTGLFSFAWVGWWYIFNFIIVMMILYLFFEIIKCYYVHKHLTKPVTKDFMHIGLMILILLVSSGIFVSLLTDINSFKSAFTTPINMASSFKIAAHSNLWPNVYTTVAELNEADIPAIVGQVSIGSTTLFALALLGIVLTLVRRTPSFKEYLLIGFSALLYMFLVSSNGLKLSLYTYLFMLMIPVAIALIMLIFEKESSIDVKPAFLIMIWFVGMIFASTKGVRFILLLIPAFSIALGIAIGYVWQYFSRISERELHMNRFIGGIIVFALLCLILIQPVRIGIAAGESYMPSMTKGWWDSLTKIRLESAPDAIINSWWDFGHWFKYVADRRVTLDGASQNNPNAHWLGRALQADTESESVAILRMLDCGSNSAFEEINKKYQDTEKSQNIVHDIILMSKDEANSHLINNGFSASEAETILKFTHCDPPENYFITSEDMVGKAGVWAHFGLWDFDRAFIINEVKPKPLDEAVDIMIERFNYTEDQAKKIYYDVQALQTDRQMNDWISPWPSYAGGLTGCTSSPDNDSGSDIVVCPLGIGIGNNGQANIVIDRAVMDIRHPENTQVTIGFYDQSGRKVQESLASFSTVVVRDNRSSRVYKAFNSTLGLGLLLDVQSSGNSTTYRSLIADPLLVSSTFTKLFFLDGRGMKHFEKFSDVTDITGARIIVWKVKW